MTEKLGFNAYFGLEEMAVTKQEFRLALERRVRRCIDTEFAFTLPDRDSTKKLYHYAFIADTFFSDSFPGGLLEELLAKSLLRERAGDQPGFDFRFLLLNPFSTLARIRAKALEDGDVYWRLNTGLHKIITALGIKADKNAFEKGKSTIEYLEQQLEQLVEQEQALGFSIRFTDQYTDLPCYIVGPYAVKGVIFPSSTATNNPWWVYVDDPIADTDSYSKHKDALEALFDESLTAKDMLTQVSEQKVKRRTVFVSWGKGSEHVKRLICDEIEAKSFDSNNNFMPLEFDDVTDAKLVPSIYRSCIERSAGAIVLLLGEDEVRSPEGTVSRRARQNVVHELGYVQSAFEDSRVLVIKEEGIETPSNLDGELVYVAPRESLEAADGELKYRIGAFLDKLK